MRRVVFASIVCVLGSLVVGTEVARAQWQPKGVFVSAAPYYQTQQQATSDGIGGVIVTWFDERNSTTSIYAQRITVGGVPSWTIDGVGICTAGNIQDHPQIATDLAGGAIITWEDLRAGNYNIYARRVSAAGTPLWTSDGNPICTAANSQESPQIMSDGVGGAFIVWPDYRSGTNYDLYAQRVNASGATLWASNGIPICTAVGPQSRPALVSDGSGGFLVAWEDGRNGSNTDIYVQLVSASGVPQWTSGGIVVGNSIRNEIMPVITTDGAGGAIMAWTSILDSSTFSVTVARIISVGVPWWSQAVEYDVGESSSTPAVVADGVGGVFVAFEKWIGPTSDIRATRINASGQRIWYAGGVVVCSESGSQVAPRISSDGTGGFIVAWNDARTSTYDVYAQRLNGAGDRMWQGSGVVIAQAEYEQSEPTLTPDGAGGTILTWRDIQNQNGWDLIAQRIDNVFGYWGHPEPLITSVADVPADQGGKVKINWNASDQDRAMIRTITHYSVWRAVDPAAASTSNVLDGPGSVGANFSGTAFYREKTPTIDYYWEWIGNQGAVFDGHYSFAAETRADSVAGHLSVHQFRVVAHTADDFVLFKSLPAFGYSVDNLAPPAPLFLTAQRVGADVQLRWNRAVAPDLRDYSLYRKTSSGVIPVPINFLGSSTDTLAVDPNAPASALYYVVTAIDVHANQSAPSNEVSVQARTGIGDTPPLTSLSVLDNMPNPFTSSTTLRVGLPKPSELEVEVFDVAGRRVRSERTTMLAAGWREIPFDARDAAGNILPSGVYFYRLSAAGATVTRKMVITR